MRQIIIEYIQSFPYYLIKVNEKHKTQQNFNLNKFQTKFPWQQIFNDNLISII